MASSRSTAWHMQRDASHLNKSKNHQTDHMSSEYMHIRTYMYVKQIINQYLNNQLLYAIEFFISFLNKYLIFKIDCIISKKSFLDINF